MIYVPSLVPERQTSYITIITTDKGFLYLKYLSFVFHSSTLSSVTRIFFFDEIFSWWNLCTNLRELIISDFKVLLKSNG